MSRRGELLEHSVLTSSPQPSATDSQGVAADTGRCLLRVVLPLSELASDLYSQVKARSRGCARLALPYHHAPTTTPAGNILSLRTEPATHA